VIEAKQLSDTSKRDRFVIKTWRAIARRSEIVEFGLYINIFGTRTADRTDSVVSTTQLITEYPICALLRKRHRTFINPLLNSRK
jgi:hypothetical protein